MKLAFAKMHGCGNDYVYVDAFASPPLVPVAEAPALARNVSRRHHAIGSDGLVYVLPPSVPGAVARMRMWNADGSEAEMCGNAIRCVAKLLGDRGHVSGDVIPIETGNGVLSVTVTREGGVVTRARVRMGVPRVEGPITLQIPGEHEGMENLTGHVVNVGNPHFVLLDERLTDHRILAIGPSLEHHSHFPRRTNVELVVVEARDQLRVRVWERGSGETLACGTGACAVLAAAHRAGRADTRAVVALPGGELLVEWPGGAGEIFLEGPCTLAFEGSVEI